MTELDPKYIPFMSPRNCLAIVIESSIRQIKCKSKLFLYNNYTFVFILTLALTGCGEFYSGSRPTKVEILRAANASAYDEVKLEALAVNNCIKNNSRKVFGKCNRLSIKTVCSREINSLIVRSKILNRDKVLLTMPGQGIVKIPTEPPYIIFDHDSYIENQLNLSCRS